eukprot:CAMPEP_0178442104 /NCGR_PEP_ID=MMETSP0689_2-20121128/37951_1 /TAXON_ID=160604 /ORGANISM="Amphidinium massartii, Strain CS-259" /LENGTH=220 /DNA_ID=CAMNT_0020065557 /DNA_START=61 /DNA_END=720 /DNA_ORIENTATION=-
MGCAAVAGMSTASLEKISAEAGLSPVKAHQSRRLVNLQLTKVEGVPLGFSFMRLNGGIVITAVARDSCLQEWNRTHAESAVLPGDTILSVNGIKTNFWAMAEETWKSGQLNILIEKKKGRQAVRYNSSRMYLETVQDHQHVPLQGPLDHLQHLTAGECTNDECCTCCTECSICLEEFASDTKVVMLPCNHVFHTACALKWVGRRGSGQCPLCRAEITSPD